MSEIKVRPAIFAPAPLRRRRGVQQAPARLRDLAVFAAGAAIGGLFALVGRGARQDGRPAPTYPPVDKTLAG